ncbi:hypothetical protein [Paracoccus sp. J56]|uniref:hypothetical protein n=1 Tax=Paracoccus sp. J56 TaxID=935850 RepID=UPI000A0BDB89|nr:hypothetical protein SAMN02746000_03475 [Paracoccus sp. J56]
MTAATRPALSFWSDTEELESVSCLQEVPNVMTFAFRSPSGALFTYEPVPQGIGHRTSAI